jgi:hypothetical protein
VIGWLKLRNSPQRADKGSAATGHSGEVPRPGRRRYDAELHWFRAALEARPAGEPLIVAVQAAIFAFPYDVIAVTKIASPVVTHFPPPS